MVARLTPLIMGLVALVAVFFLVGEVLSEVNSQVDQIRVVLEA